MPRVAREATDLLDVSTLLGDGVRVLTRTMKKITDIVGVIGTQLRDRSRSVKLRLLEIARIARHGTAQPGAAAAAVSPLARCDEPGGWTGEAVLGRNKE